MTGKYQEGKLLFYYYKYPIYEITRRLRKLTAEDLGLESHFDGA